MLYLNPVAEYTFASSFFINQPGVLSRIKTSKDQKFS